MVWRTRGIIFFLAYKSLTSSFRHLPLLIRFFLAESIGFGKLCAVPMYSSSSSSSLQRPRSNKRTEQPVRKVRQGISYKNFNVGCGSVGDAMIRRTFFLHTRTLPRSSCQLTAEKKTREWRVRWQVFVLTMVFDSSSYQRPHHTLPSRGSTTQRSDLATHY